jgi:hypothetical protein
LVGATAAFIAAFLLTGCNDVPKSDAPPRNERCPGGKTQPLGLHTVVAASRRHGITFYTDPQCDDPSVVSQAANILLYGPHTNSQHGDEIQEREGDVTCSLFARRTFSANVQRIHYPGDQQTEFRVLNVECFIFPDPAKEDDQVRRLSDVMNDLLAESGYAPEP